MFFLFTKFIPSDKSSKKFISIPYYKSISEGIANLLKSFNVFTTFKPQFQIKSFLLKDKS